MPRKPAGLNTTACASTINALLAAGKLDESADAARIATALSLASAVDAAPSNASLWREYRAAEAELHEVRDSGSDDEAALIATLSAEVCDAPQPRTPQSRTTSSRRR